MLSAKEDGIEISVENDNLQRELELLRTSFWDFDKFAENKILSICKNPFDSKLISSSANFDGI